MNRLKELRLNAKMTLRKLSDISGIVNSFLSDLERGKRKMNANHARVLAPIFKVTEAYIMGDDAIKLDTSIFDFLLESWDDLFDRMVSASVNKSLDEKTRIIYAILDDLLHKDLSIEELKTILNFVNELKGDDR